MPGLAMTGADSSAVIISRSADGAESATNSLESILDILSLSDLAESDFVEEMPFESARATGSGSIRLTDFAVPNLVVPCFGNAPPFSGVGPAA
eukprot:CAMPEP_0202812178 /NCGR_PEP_ID=MMETSP1389-20130828/3873_1 /ASSEMBLY_ACC=CAM_ASM_000865 /TAXON_ID=302021 /ORGANISM="Rhodomonas sp., Strain CCMP768" /LENGTH=92 /DNA_ID=CAMNT_0049483501 /DNA_START=434 /DNA_END=712 /DNA_ORIENTATION=-